jgi:hypothetical protein
VLACVLTRANAACIVPVITKPTVGASCDDPGMAKKKANRPAPNRSGVPLFVYVPQDLRDRLDQYKEREAASLPGSVRGKFTVSDAVRDLLEKALSDAGFPAPAK